MYLENLKCNNEYPLNVEILHINEYPLHMHEYGYIEIIYVLKGSINLYISTEDICLKADDVFIVNEANLHYIHDCSDDNVVQIYHIYLDAFSDYYAEFSQVLFILNTTYNNDVPELIEYVKNLLRNISKQFFDIDIDHNPLNNIHENLVSLLLCLTNSFQYWYIKDNKIQPTNPYKDKPIQVNRIRNIVRYMYENYQKKLTLDDIAEHEYLSKYYISHLFTSVLGESYQNIITRLRVEMSLMGIADTSKNLEEVAIESGFSSPTFLRRRYKDITGYSPFEVRNYFKSRTIEVMKPDITHIDNVSDIVALLSDTQHYTYPVTLAGRKNLRNYILDFSKSQNAELKGTWNYIYVESLFECLRERYRANLSFCRERFGFSHIIVSVKQLLDAYEALKCFDFLHEFLRSLQMLDMDICVIDDRNDTCFFDDAVRSFESWCMEKYSIGVKCIENIASVEIISLHGDNPADMMRHLLDGTDVIRAVSIESLFNRAGLKKPLYYLYEIVCSLDEHIIEAAENCIVTREGNSMHVMIYYSIRDSVDTESQCSEFLLKLVNHGGCILKIEHLKDFDISEESIWHSINSPELISEDTMEYITAAASLLADIRYVPACPEYDVFIPLYRGQCALITIECKNDKA